jgi:hypothetical protein
VAWLHPTYRSTHSRRASWLTGLTNDLSQVDDTPLEQVRRVNLS